MPKFKKKPVVIEARQLLNDNAGEIAAWCGGTVRGGPKGGSRGGSVLIKTLEGVMEARPGWWVIEGVQGEFYPCDPDIFAATYTAAAAPVPAPATDGPPSAPTGEGTDTP